jgi:hypothetical protein
MPSNWLRDQCWLEDPQPPKPKKPRVAVPKPRGGSKAAKPAGRKTKKAGQNPRRQQNRRSREADVMTLERQQQAERQKKAEWARQQAERQRQAELERQHQAELERQRQAQLAQREAERQRQAELVRLEADELEQTLKRLLPHERDVRQHVVVAHRILRLYKEMDEIDVKINELLAEADALGEGDVRALLSGRLPSRSFDEELDEYLEQLEREEQLELEAQLEREELFS